MKILLLLVLLSACGKNSHSPGLQSESNEVTEETYLSLVNQHRLDLGLRPLTYSSIIESVSREHSDYMSEGLGHFGHSGWRSRCSRLKAELGGYGCGEIVAYGQETPKAVFEAWLNSPSHRKTIEDPNFTQTGLGMAQNIKGQKFWTQIFLMTNSHE